MNNVVLDYPPNWKKIEVNFQIGESKPLFAYAPYIYNPFDIFIDPTLYLHEMIHIKQQGDKPEQWWDKYILDKDFRFSQELEANRKQLQLFYKVVKDKNERYRFMLQIAKNMSSILYGNMVEYNQAIKLLQHGRN